VSFVGLFDSGVGGVSVLQALRQQRPDLDYVYLADLAWAPYGPLPPARIRERALRIGHWLQAGGAGMVVVACNTASAWAASALERALEVPVVGMVEPTREALEAGAPGGALETVVWATSATLRSGAYAGVGTVVATPLLAPLVEAGHLDDGVATAVVGEYLRCLPPGTRRLVLGCTHYSFLVPLIKHLAPHLQVVDSAHQGAACAARQGLPNGGGGSVRHFATGEAAAYQLTLRALGVTAEVKEVALETGAEVTAEVAA
jgi:glutamate racemase